MHSDISEDEALVDDFTDDSIVAKEQKKTFVEKLEVVEDEDDIDEDFHFSSVNTGVLFYSLHFTHYSVLTNDSLHSFLAQTRHDGRG